MVQIARRIDPTVIREGEPLQITRSFIVGCTHVYMPPGSSLVPIDVVHQVYTHIHACTN
jgi:hypothetical protein